MSTSTKTRPFEGFRFTDTRQGHRYADTPFAVLPVFAALIVTEVLGLAPGEWDRLVRSREVIELTGIGFYPVRGAYYRRCSTCLGESIGWTGECPECRNQGEYLILDGELLEPVGTPVAGRRVAVAA